jgi:hypothetical protein
VSSAGEASGPDAVSTAKTARRGEARSEGLWKRRWVFTLLMLIDAV